MWVYLAKYLACNALWVKKLHDQNSHDQKLTPMHVINNSYGKNFIFYLNISFKNSVLHQFPTFYTNILQSWKRNFCHISYTPNCLGFPFLQFNSFITIDNNPVHFKEFQSHNILYQSSYLHLRKNLKTGITSKENFNSTIIYTANLHKFRT